MSLADALTQAVGMVLQVLIPPKGEDYPTLLQWQRDGDPRFGHWYATGVMLPDNWRDLL